MSIGRGDRVAVFPWIFIHDTDKVKGGLMVLFFGLVFFPLPLPSPLESFLPKPLGACTCDRILLVYDLFVSVSKKFEVRVLQNSYYEKKSVM